MKIKLKEVVVTVSIVGLLAFNIFNLVKINNLEKSIKKMSGANLEFSEQVLDTFDAMNFTIGEMVGFNEVVAEILTK